MKYIEIYEIYRTKHNICLRIPSYVTLRRFRNIFLTLRPVPAYVPGHHTWEPANHSGSHFTFCCTYPYTSSSPTCPRMTSTSSLPLFQRGLWTTKLISRTITYDIYLTQRALILNIQMTCFWIWWPVVGYWSSVNLHVTMLLWNFTFTSSEFLEFP